jgi:hypothetical protein
MRNTFDGWRSMGTAAHGRWRRLALAASALVLALGMSGCAPRGSSTPLAAPRPAQPKVAPADDSALARVLSGGGLAAVKVTYGEPLGSFSQPAGAEDNMCELWDGSQASFEWGFSRSGAPVVVTHSVSDTGAPCVKFTRAFSDGVTSVDQANAYLSRVTAGDWTPIVPKRAGPWIKAYLWTFRDGSGFVVKDYSGWSASDRQKYNGSRETTLYGYTWGHDHMLEDDTGG